MHFTNAAEKLRIGQPTLSYQMKTLEDEQCKLVFANFESAKEVPSKSFQFECG
ncbi:helix-turn-helix domain-containing protein [Paenisporosarcina sp.]|uniref:helix-turn-helix domain-containing protein n=1 Tax=Paenisporosarcina sp. TaxID=1932001 RepID=UPI003C70D1AD